MIVFENTFRDLLIQANVVGNRVFFGHAPQRPASQMTSPYIVFFLITPTPYLTHNGPLNIIDREYQVSIFDTSQTTAHAIADTLRGYLDGRRGVFENVDFGFIAYTQQTYTDEPDTRLFQVIQEYRMMYRFLDSNAVPTVVINRRKREDQTSWAQSRNR